MAEKGYSYGFMNRTYSITAMNISQKIKIGLFFIPISLAWGAESVPKALPELCSLLTMPSAEIRRLAASAIGKLAGFGAEATTAVSALAPVALHDEHPQVQQYALKALKAYGAAAEHLLPDLTDLAQQPTPKDYVRQTAHAACEAIKAAVQQGESARVNHCQKCNCTIAPDEHERSQKAFQRNYCDHCFDQVYLERRNWETQVELQKTIQAADGTLVQSDGERQIAEWLNAHQIAYRYDNRFRIIKGYAIRPDFYLPEYDLYIEYWGMDTLDYQIGMLEKKKLYQQASKKLISLYRNEKQRLPELLSEYLSRYMRLPPSRSAMPSPCQHLTPSVSETQGIQPARASQHPHGASASAAQGIQPACASQHPHGASASAAQVIQPACAPQHPHGASASVAQVIHPSAPLSTRMERPQA